MGAGQRSILYNSASVLLPILTLSADALCILISHGTSWIAEIIHWIISPNVRPQGRQESLAIFPHACLGRYVWIESHVSLDPLGKLIL